MRPNPDDRVLQRFASSLVRRPQCKEHKKGVAFYLPRLEALKQPYVQLNALLVRYLVFDLDQPEAGAAWLDADLPTPTIIVRTPETGRAHFLYELVTPVSQGGDARPKPIRFMEAVWDRMEIALKADATYVRRFVKNPLHDSWDVLTRDIAYDLCKLNDFVSHIKRPPRIPSVHDAGEGRNCTLFNALSRWAPTVVNSHDDYDPWLDCCLDKARELNSELDDPLRASEVRTIAKSVARYRWDHRRGACNGGRRRYRVGKLGMAPLSVHLDPTDRVKAKRERHAVGGRTVSERRRRSTEERVRQAISDIQNNFGRPTIVDVADRISMSREHLSRRYRHLFD